MCLLGFVILALFHKRRKYDGQMLLMYMTWYGLERFIVEGIRTDSLMLGNLRVSQALSAVLVAASVIIQVIMHFRIKRDPERYILYCNTDESAALMAESDHKIKSNDTDENYQKIAADEQDNKMADDINSKEKMKIEQA